MSDLTIVLRSLFSHRVSTTITVLSVAVAVALLVVLLTLRSAAAHAFSRGSGNAHLLVSADSSPLTAVLNGLFHAGTPPRALSAAKVAELCRLFPFEWTVAMQQGDSYRGHPTVAVEPDFFERFEPVAGAPWRFREGRALERRGGGEAFEVVAGSDVARGSNLRIGDRLHLTHGSGTSREGSGHVHDEYAFEVVGIVEPTGTAHDRALFIDLEASWILHAHDRRERDGSLHAADHGDDHGEEPAHDEHVDDHEHDHDDAHADDRDHEHDDEHAHVHPRLTADDLVDDDRLVTGLLLRLPTRAGSGAPAALQQVHDTLRRDTTITVAQPAEEIRRLMNIVGNVDGLFLAMAAAVLVSSAVAIMLALYDGMAARRRQIAVLRVLGFTRGRIAGMVVTESALIGAAGAVAGLLIGVVGSRLASGYVASKVGVVIDAGLDLRSAIVVAGAAVVLAALAGSVPAMAAYRTPVWRSLRPLG